MSYEIYGQILFSLRDLWLRDLWEAYEIYGSLRDLWEGLRDLWEFARFMGVTRFMGRTPPQSSSPPIEKLIKDDLDLKTLGTV